MTAARRAAAARRQVVAELRALLRLTRTEAEMAEARRGQAATPALAGALAELAGDARRRADLVQAQLRRLGGSPDLLTRTADRVGSAVTSGMQQLQPLRDLLLSDLALEHHLQDRARRLAGLATAAGDEQVRLLAERLEEAHAASVRWLTDVVDDEASAGVSALRPAAARRLAGTGLRLALAPVGMARAGVEVALGQLVRTHPASPVAGASGPSGATGTVTPLRTERPAAPAPPPAPPARPTPSAAPSPASDGTAEQPASPPAADAARSSAAADAGGSAAPASEGGTAPTGGQPPLKGYDTLNAAAVVAAVRALDDADRLRELADYERATKARRGVLSAVASRLARLEEAQPEEG